MIKAGKPNAGGEPRPRAGARHERRLLGVGSSAGLGWGYPVGLEWSTPSSGSLRPPFSRDSHLSEHRWANPAPLVVSPVRKVEQ